MATLTRGQIASAARAAGFPESQIPMAVAVALAESGGNPRATNNANRNGSSDYGLWQINTVHKSLLAGGNKYDPADNAKMAYSVWKSAGGKWTPWSVYNSGSYKRFYTGTADVSASLPARNVGDPATPDPTVEQKIVAGLNPLAPFGGLGGFGLLQDKSFWTRFGIFALGVALIILGVVIIFRKPIMEGTEAVTAVVVPEAGLAKTAASALT